MNTKYDQSVNKYLKLYSEIALHPRLELQVGDMMHRLVQLDRQLHGDPSWDDVLNSFYENYGNGVTNIVDFYHTVSNKIFKRVYDLLMHVGHRIAYEHGLIPMGKTFEKWLDNMG